MQKRRFFIAINLPDEIKNILISLQSKVDRKYYKLTDQNNLHITLLFLGYLNDKELLKIQNILKESIPRSSNFYANLTDILFLPNDKNPRIISVYVKSKGKLEKIQKIIQNKLSELDFTATEKREFKPHITIARQKGWKYDIKNFNHIITLKYKWKVKNISLMESILKPEGAKHKTILEYDLK